MATHSVRIETPANTDRAAASYNGGLPSPTVKASGVPAVLARYSGQTSNPLDAQKDRWLLLLEPDADVTRFDEIVDEADGARYAVEDLAVRAPTGPLQAVAHTRATLIRVQP